MSQENRRVHRGIGIAGDAPVPRVRYAFFVLTIVTVMSSSVRAQDPPSDPDQPPDRIFGVLPNFGTVENAANVPPITASQRFRIASLSSFDPFVYPFVALTAGIAHLRGQEPTWRGTSGYLKHYAAAFSDNAIGNMMTTAIVSTLANQDPRYYVLGTGGFWHRAAYAASRTVVTRRHGHLQFNVSELGGNAVAAGLSNFYYPVESRSTAETIDRWQTQVMWDTLSNELKEFWPDLRRTLFHR
jgi:hypothetical protein